MSYNHADARNIVTGFYNQYMGRAPDESGMDYWSTLLQQGKPPNDVAAYMQNVGMLGELPKDPSQPMGGGGGIYRDTARSATAGMNRMPFVFSDYANLSAAPGAAMSTIFPPAANQWQQGGQSGTEAGGIANPVLAGGETEAAAQGQQNPGNRLFAEGLDAPAGTYRNEAGQLFGRGGVELDPKTGIPIHMLENTPPGFIEANAELYDPSRFTNPVLR